MKPSCGGPLMAAFLNPNVDTWKPYRIIEILMEDCTEESGKEFVSLLPNMQQNSYTESPKKK